MIDELLGIENVLATANEMAEVLSALMRKTLGYDEDKFQAWAERAKRQLVEDTLAGK